MKNPNKNAGKPVLKLTVNKKSYDWFEQFITEEQLRELGQINADDKFYLKEKRNIDRFFFNYTKIDLIILI